MKRRNERGRGLARVRDTVLRYAYGVRLGPFPVGEDTTDVTLLDTVEYFSFFDRAGSEWIYLRWRA